MYSINRKIILGIFLGAAMCCIDVSALTTDQKLLDADIEYLKTHPIDFKVPNIDKNELKEVIIAGFVKSEVVSKPVETMKKWMQPECYARWEKLTAPIVQDGKSPILSDFFLNAIIFVGVQNVAEGYVAFYNLWYDAILIVKTDNSTKIRNVANFAFLPGEVFRGGSVSEKYFPQTLHIQKNISYSEQIIFLSAKTENVFLQYFQNKELAEKSLVSFISKMNEATFESIHNTGVLRFFILAQNIKSKNQTALFAKLCDFLFNNNGDITKSKITINISPACQIHLNEYFKIPCDTRKIFTLCNIAQSKNFTVYCFTVKNIPEVIMIAAVDKKKQTLIEFIIYTFAKKGFSHE